MNNLTRILTFFLIHFSAHAQIDHSDPVIPQAIISDQQIVRMYDPSGRVLAKHMTDQDQQVLTRFRNASTRLKKGALGTEPMHLLDSTITISNSGDISSKYTYKYSDKGDQL